MGHNAHFAEKLCYDVFRVKCALSHEVTEVLMEIQFHPISGLFPMLADDRAAELAADIRAKGLIEPITLYEGKILDGRNRYLACRVAGVDVRTDEYTGDDPVGWVISKNRHRRHLTDDQWAMVGVQSLPMIEAETEKRRRASISTARSDETVLNSTPSEPLGSGYSRRTAAASVGVSQDRIRRAKALNAVAPDLGVAVALGEISLRQAEEVAKKDKPIRPNRRPSLNPAAHVPGQVAAPPRPPRGDPALADRLYKMVQSFPEKRAVVALAGEIQTANLDLPRDAIRKLRTHLKEANSGRLALDRGLETLLTNRSNSTA